MGKIGGPGAVKETLLRASEGVAKALQKYVGQSCTANVMENIKADLSASFKALCDNAYLTAEFVRSQMGIAVHPMILDHEHVTISVDKVEIDPTNPSTVVYTVKTDRAHGKDFLPSYETFDNYVSVGRYEIVSAAIPALTVQLGRLFPGVRMDEFEIEECHTDAMILHWREDRMTFLGARVKSMVDSSIGDLWERGLPIPETWAMKIVDLIIMDAFNWFSTWPTR